MERLAGTPVHIPIHRASPIDLDDAFSDGDDSTTPYQFSSAVVRQDMKNVTDWTPDSTDSVDPDNSFETQNTSVSTLDIESISVSRTLSSPLRSPDGAEDLANFTQISLNSKEEGGEELEVSVSSPGEGDMESYAPYPNIIIETVGSSAHQTHVRSTSNQSISSQTSVSGPPSNCSPKMRASSLTSSSPPSTLHVEPKNHSTSAIPTPVPASSPPPPSSIQSPQSPQSPKSQGQGKLGHRPTRSVGPSALEKVRSKTRPPFLPPKNRKEDDKHMADWEAMMKLSRAAAEKRRGALQERRLAREKAIEETIHVWEKEILPNWKVVFKNPALRKLWWRGIPTKLRASMWERAIGNPLALNKDHYRTCLARANRALSSGVFPQNALALIEQDISGTLPALHIFRQDTGPLYADLKEMLCAWVVSRSDEGLGYTLGAAKIAAMLLINMSAQPAFVVMRNLLERHCMRSFFGGDGTKDDAEAYYRIFDTLLADGMPKIYFNFKQHQISPAAYLPKWLIPLFLDHLPFEACARIWDVFILEGDSFLYRTALGILGVLEPRLFFPERKELLELLNGENKAALDVAKREGVALDGGKYEIYGVDEETLWERIDSMEDWWKESTWTRLIQRELPDM